jgi:LysM repeat protein
VRLVALLLVLCSVPCAALAQELQTIRIRVRNGDTLQLLAAEFYGDRSHAVFIMKANGLTHPRALRPGERVKIPIQQNVTASVGDTLEGLAEQYMGDARRAEFLAEFNNLPADATIAAGQVIVIPFHVTHTAQSLESVESIAAAYFGDAQKAALVRRYNFTDKRALESNETLVIPIYNVRVRPSKLPPVDKKSAEREARLREMEERALEVLPEAQAAWRAGEYTKVKRLLVDLDLDYLPMNQAAAVGVLLGCAYIAFGDDDSAVAIFDKVLRRKPEHSLSTYEHSPKILDVWRRAGGKATARPTNAQPAPAPL